MAVERNPFDGTKEAIELLNDDNEKYKTLFIDMFGLEAYNKHSK